MCMPLVHCCSSMAVTVPSLQLQCLYSVAGRLEEYSTQTLSLLPTSLRRQLLVRLPVVDICRLERDETFMSGLGDLENVWRKLKKVSFISMVLRSDWSSESPRPAPTYRSAKDEILTDVAHVFLANASARRAKRRDELLKYYMYGVRVCSGMLAVKLSLCTYREQYMSLPLGGGRYLSRFVWAVPQRFSHESTNTPNMLKKFLDCSKWHPTVVQLTEKLRCLDRLSMFLDLFPHMEELYVSSDRPNSAPMMSSVLQAVIKAAARPSNLKTVSLAGYSSDLYTLITMLFTALHTETSEGPCLHNGLLKLELMATTERNYYFQEAEALVRFCYFTRLSWAMENLVQLISHQATLESLVITNFVNQSYDGELGVFKTSYREFGFFYNFLPHFISKPSFKSLHIVACKVPSNSIQSMIEAFLSNATSDDISVHFERCIVIKNSLDKVPEVCHLRRPEELSLYQVGAEKRCISGGHKSLSVPVGEPLLPLHWLGNYPGLRLQRLDLQLHLPTEAQAFFSDDEDSDDDNDENPGNHTVKSEATYNALDLLGPFVGTLCLTIIGVKRCPPAMAKVLECPHLKELRLVKCDYRREDCILSVLTGAIQRAQSLCQLSFDILTSASETILTRFFASLFSLPREQLSNVGLSLGIIGRAQVEVIAEAWKLHSKCKLRAITYRPKTPSSALRSIAVESH